MPRLNSIILQDMLHSAKRVLTKLEGQTPDALWRDEDLQDIVIRHFTVIGEAATHFPESARTRVSQVNWKRITIVPQFHHPRVLPHGLGES